MKVMQIHHRQDQDVRFEELEEKNAQQAAADTKACQ
jgi:hypothetical protein